MYMSVNDTEILGKVATWEIESHNPSGEHQTGLRTASGHMHMLLSLVESSMAMELCYENADVALVPSHLPPTRAYRLLVTRTKAKA